MAKETYTIDANGKSIGRIASEAAICLLGKKTPAFKKNLVHDLEVNVVNASKIRVLGKKRTTMTYKRYSGYPSGLKEPNMEQVIAKKGYEEVIRHAVMGMLPKNTLRDKRMKLLKVTE